MLTKTQGNPALIDVTLTAAHKTSAKAQRTTLSIVTTSKTASLRRMPFRACGNHPLPVMRNVNTHPTTNQTDATTAADRAGWTSNCQNRNRLYGGLSGTPRRRLRTRVSHESPHKPTMDHPANGAETAAQPMNHGMFRFPASRLIGTNIIKQMARQHLHLVDTT